MQTFTGSTIRHSFKRCGIWPLDSEVICKELRGDDDGRVLAIYDGDDEHELPEWGSWREDEGKGKDASQPRTPSPLPASSSTINSPPTTVAKLRKNISKVQKSFSSTSNPDLAKIQRRLEAIYEGSITQAELAAQTSADISRILTNQEAASAPKTRRQVGRGGVLSVKDCNTIIRSRDIQEAEKQRRKWERDAKKQLDEMQRHDLIRDQENRRREEALEWVPGDDGQPLYCIDTKGTVL